MKPKYIIFILLAVISFSCNDNETSYIWQSNEILYSNPDSVLYLLSLIDNPSKLKDENKAEYWRIRSLAHNLKHTAMVNDSPVLFSLNYYKSKDDTAKIKETYLLAADCYKWIEKRDSTISLLTEAWKYAESVKDTAFLITSLRKIGFFYLENKEKEKAVNTYKKIIAQVPDPFSYYILALQDDNKDSVLYYRDKSIESALYRKDTLATCHYLRNYASILYINKEYHKAEESIRQIKKLSPKCANTDLIYLLLSQINIASGNIEAAQEYLNKASEISKSNAKNLNDSNDLLNSIATTNINSILQAVIDTKEGKVIDVSSICAFNDSIISSIERKNEILNVQQADQLNLETRNMRLTISKYRIQTAFVISIFSAVVLILFFYLYLLKRKRRFEEVQERTETLQTLYRQALNVKDEKEKNSLLFKNTLLQQLGIMRLIAGSTVPRSQELLRQIINISNETVSTESLLIWKDLYSIIDSIYNNFYTSLSEKYGYLLSGKEIQLCCLLCANFSTIEISAIMQLSIQTIYQRKSSIRKKLNMDEKEDIILFLKEDLQ